MVCRIDIVELGDGCVFEYHDPVATVTDIVQEFNTSSNQINLTVEGSGFIADDLVYTELWVDGEMVPLISVSATEAVFELDYALDTSTSDFVFYTIDGLPSGLLPMVYFDPALVSISVNIGSTGGFTTQVRGVGFGIET